MTVYQRTPEGKWAAYHADSPLPRKLKILLKAINGTLTEDVYATNLSAFGDVRELLRSLVQAGLIEESNQRNSHAVPNPAAIMVKLEQLVRRFSLPQKDEAAFSPVRAPVAARMHAPMLDPAVLPVPQVIEADIELPIADAVVADAVVAEAVVVETTDPAVADWALHRAIESMASFVLSALPGNAFQLLPEIESLTTLDELAVLMDGYAQFVAEAGEAGRAHLAQLHGLLAAGRGMVVVDNAVLTP
jgi:hypothetical protein